MRVRAHLARPRQQGQRHRVLVSPVQTESPVQEELHSLYRAHAHQAIIHSTRLLVPVQLVLAGICVLEGRRNLSRVDARMDLQVIRRDPAFAQRAQWGNFVLVEVLHSVQRGRTTIKRSR